jgi:hypothetical protein
VGGPALLEEVQRHRGTLDGFDVALLASPGADMQAFARAGATWAVWSLYPPDPAEAMRVVLAGPGALAT